MPAAFKIDPHFKPRPSTDPAQLSPHLTEFVAREFARGSPLSVVVARIGHLDSPSERFWVSQADAMSGLLATINSGGGSDSITEHHHPGKYRVEHLLDPACEVLVSPLYSGQLAQLSARLCRSRRARSRTSRRPTR